MLAENMMMIHDDVRSICSNNNNNKTRTHHDASVKYFGVTIPSCMILINLNQWRSREDIRISHNSPFRGIGWSKMYMAEDGDRGRLQQLGYCSFDCISYQQEQ
jgi:hypothetical protein